MLGFSATITTSLPPAPAICEGPVGAPCVLRVRERSDEKDGVCGLHHRCLLLEPTMNVWGHRSVSCAWLCGA
jgi:hypothetical protein